LVALFDKQGVDAHQERGDPLPNKNCESRVDLGWGGCIEDRQSHPKNARRTLRFLHFGLGLRAARIGEKTDRCDRGHDFVEQRKAFCGQVLGEKGHACDVAPWTVEACNEAKRDWVRTQ
jgi:hypothetical protein